MFKLFTKFLFFSFLIIALFSSSVVFASNTDGTVTGVAWSKNIGWINFGVAGGNIHVTDSVLTGEAWNKYFGWIKLNPVNGGVTNNAEGTLSGTAWGKNIGWVNFSGVTINSSGLFRGTATGSNIGNINFSCLTCNVTTDWRPASTRGGAVCGDGICNGTETCSSCIADCGGCGGGGPLPQTHLECSNSACVSVDGAGANLCQTNTDCVTVSHNECINHACVSVAGAGTNQCQTNTDCLAISHNECSNNTCISVAGAGTNQCQTNADCVVVSHNECSNHACVSVAGAGTNQCQTNTDCAAVFHNECSNNACVSVSGAGVDLCQTNTDCIIKHNECSSEKCVAVDGAGSNQCQTDVDCKITHFECSKSKCVSVDGFGINQCSVDKDCVIEKHNECNLQSQCVAVDGAGSDLCKTDDDCAVFHNECSNKQCLPVKGVGIDQCKNDAGCAVLKHNECSVQYQCVAVDGAGSNQCQTNTDCAVFHNECSNNACVSVNGIGIDQCQGNSDCLFDKHNECNSQNQCVSVNGVGSDQCQTNSDCAKLPPGGITPPLGGVAPPPTGGVPPETVSPTQVITPIEIINNFVLPASEKIAETAKKQVEQLSAGAAEVKKAIETPQGSVVTKTVSTAGAVAMTAVVATNIAVSSFSLLDFLSIFARLGGLLLTVFGIKKRVLPWGTVYDSITKQPIDPARVILKDKDGKEIASAITDLDGRYGFLVDKGVYNIIASKTNYDFPSKNLTGKTEDEIYKDLYFGETIEVKEAGKPITKNIPLDPLNFNWNEFVKTKKGLNRFWSRWDVILRRISDILFIIGFVVAVIIFFAVPQPYNIVILALYVVLLLIMILGLKPKASGLVIDKTTGEALSFAIVRVLIPPYNIEFSHKVTDARGRYFCLAPKGDYFVKIEKKNEDGSYSLVYTSPIKNGTKEGIVKTKFRI